MEGNLLRRYVYGNYIDEPIMMHVQDMVEAAHRGDYYYVQDALYNVRALVSGQGYCIEEKAAYDAYGRPMVWTGADFNMDGQVDGDDFTLYWAARGTSVGNPDFDWRCDVNQDGTVDPMDPNAPDYAAFQRYYDTSRRPDQASYFTNPYSRRVRFDRHRTGRQAGRLYYRHQVHPCNNRMAA